MRNFGSWMHCRMSIRTLEIGFVLLFAPTIRVGVGEGEVRYFGVRPVAHVVVSRCHIILIHLWNSAILLVLHQLRVVHLVVESIQPVRKVVTIGYKVL